ncbi:PhoX family protein [Aestuariimicrobium soli]|uniref:PhoX family protein n=1 Tax=Aestuariimicrobium soli TaxID=2035834 RepID=UPI003EBFB404
MRSLLPLLTRSHEGGRSAMTCHYKCGDACAKPDANDSSNAYFGDVVAASVSRRTALAGVLGLGLAGVAAPAFAQGDDTVSRPGGGRLVADRFTGIAPQPAATDDVVVPAGWQWKPVIAWGDAVLPGAPAFDFERQTVDAQLKQFGYNNDFLAILSRGATKATLVANHEYTNDELMFRGYTGSASLTTAQLEVIMAAHGMTVVEVERRSPNHAWQPVVTGKRNRRIHTHTEFEVTGAAAGHDLLKTSADPSGTRVLGTLNNCAGGVTPWGTILSGEENVDQYFNATGAPADRLDSLRRYTITSGGRGWERADARFAVATEPNEVHRFNWIVEIDPENPTSTPKKHTALGRFKHEGAAVTVDPDGTVVVYSGDDARFEYVYKFVSSKTFAPGGSKQAKAHNLTLLEEGDLYVASFTGDGTADGEWDGTGTWLPLVVDGQSKVAGMSVAEVLVYTRIAADKVGATKMDRPEDVEVNPVNNRLYMAMTNNTARVPSQVDEANPRASNKHGHVVELTPSAGGHADASFTWKLVLICGNPDDATTYFNGYDKSAVTPISCPDNVTFDQGGNLWISTDGQPGTLNHCDGLFMMPVDGPEKGKLCQFLSVPVGAETCGPWIMEDEKSVLVAVQHPGEVDGASPDHVVTTFPYTGVGQPRPAVVQVIQA